MDLKFLKYLISLCIALISATPLFSQVRFERHLLFKRTPDVYRIWDADLDGDQDVDLVVFGQNTHTIFWLENDGKQNFAEHLITDEFEQPNSLFPVDLDSDGDLDILCSVYRNYAEDGLLVWFENEGNYAFTTHRLSEYEDATYIWGIDFDHDGDQDILSSCDVGLGITWWENDGELNFTPHNFCRFGCTTMSFIPFDMDRDGDFDFMVIKTRQLVLEYWENEGDLNFTKTSFEHGIKILEIFDIDFDLDYDLFLSCDRDDVHTYFWKNDGFQNFEQEILFPDGRDFLMADFDLDSDMDFLCLENYCVNDSDLNFHCYTFEEMGFFKCTPKKVVDLDNDGDPDFLADTGNYDYFNYHECGEIAWYENLGKPARVTFSDKNLERVIQTSLGETGALYDTSLVKLTRLEAVDQSIQNLSGLESAIRLKTLNLQQNRVTNLTPLRTLTSLDTLILAENQLSDSALTALYRLDSLSFLNLLGNPQIRFGTEMEKLANELERLDCKDILWDGVCGVDPNSAPFLTDFQIAPDSLLVNENLRLSIAAGDSEFHAVKFFIDWSDSLAVDSTGWLKVDTLYQFAHVYLAPGDYSIKIRVVDEKGATSVWREMKTIIVRFPAGVTHLNSNTRHEFKLFQNYPNPFNMQTKINYELPEAGAPVFEIFNIQGKLVKQFVPGFKPAGTHFCEWNGKSENGEELASGVYWCCVRFQNYREEMKLLLLK